MKIGQLEPSQEEYYCFIAAIHGVYTLHTCQYFSNNGVCNYCAVP